ncbi:LamG-like jellyroll fold domain-containing protein [uncultured Microbacterium sp.]|uniref:LamG-like jellyroll fold domain-containing protein n=1 Tax=uncultured Microbacterium sp. TaxID=191216 RepID=UPI0025E2FE1B|nr:LamG-like jellyroll fold domain-containing protein [uncultured Microbacterium sp.]
MNTLLPVRPPSPRRSVRAATALATVAALAASLLGVGAAAPATAAEARTASTAAPTATPRSSFVLPVLPDTQFYSRYSASQFMPQYGTNPFEVQNQWIVDNKAALNIPFALQLGDVVDQQWVSGEWDAADRAMKILENGRVPYSIIPGNHDVADQSARSSTGNAANYLARFGATRLAAQAGSTLLGTFQNGYSSAYRFTAEGRPFIVLSLGWNASDDTFAWAQGILDSQPGVPVILTSHAIIGIAQDQVSPESWWYGDLLWDKLIRKNDQIVLTLNGHFHGSTMRTLTNDAGHPVYEILADYQMAADGGNGIMSLLEFDLSGNAVSLSTVSPWVGKKSSGSRTSTDTPVLTGPGQNMRMDVDFAGRFGWTAPAASDVDDVDLTALAKQIVSTGWTAGTTQDRQEAAGSPEDYHRVAGTIAHWRFGTVPEGAVGDTTVIPDIAGASPMYRNPVDATDADDKPEDLTITHTNVPFYSADKGAACFSNVHRNSGARDNLSYLTTEYGAPATFANLTAGSGYTVETFVQLSGDWTEAANRWGAAITRGGARQWIGINDTSDAGAGAAWLGISNLREYQFSAADTQTKNSYTLWSGEIMPGSWHHVAIVGDPRARTVIMYVDGVPVLRNAAKVGGMMAADFMPWILGASTWNTEPEHGWNGCIGETRIVDHALAPQQFLFERQDIAADGSGFAVSTDLAGVKASGTSIAEVTGTGSAGTTVGLTVDDRAAGSTVVGADGTWRIVLDRPLAGVGVHALAFSQTLGSRTGAPYKTSLTIGVDDAWRPSEAGLSPAAENKVTVAPARVEHANPVTVTVPTAPEGGDLHAYLFAGTTRLGRATVTSGAVTFTVPRAVAAGSYRIAVYTSTGELLGWQTLAVTADVPDPVAPTQPSGSTAGKVDVSTPAPGARTVVVSAGAANAGKKLDVWAWSTPTKVGTQVQADPSGRVEVDISTLPSGHHTLALTQPGDAEFTVLAWGEFDKPITPGEDRPEALDLAAAVTASDLWSLSAEKTTVDFGAVARATRATRPLGIVTVVDDRAVLRGWELSASWSDFRGEQTLDRGTLTLVPTTAAGYAPPSGVSLGAPGSTAGTQKIADSAAVSTTLTGARWGADLTFAPPANVAAGTYASTLTLTLVSK